MANGEIANYKQFHHLSQCFQKSSAAIPLKWVCRRERVKELMGERVTLPMILFSTMTIEINFMLISKVCTMGKSWKLPQLPQVEPFLLFSKCCQIIIIS